MIFLSVNEIIRIHEKLLAVTGGFAGICDMGLLESATFSAVQSYDNNEACPTTEEKAARIL